MDDRPEVSLAKIFVNPPSGHGRLRFLVMNVRTDVLVLLRF